MLYQYFHRPGQNLYVRGYENEPEFEGQQQNGRTNAEGEVCITGVYQGLGGVIKGLSGVIKVLLAFSSKFVKVEKILKGSLVLIPLPSPTVKIQIIDGKAYLR